MRTGRGAERNDCSLGRSSKVSRNRSRWSRLASYITGCAFLHVRNGRSNGRLLFLTRTNNFHLRPFARSPPPLRLSEGLIPEFDERSIDLRSISPRETFVERHSKILSRWSLIMESLAMQKTKRNFFQSKRDELALFGNREWGRKEKKKSSITFANVA